MAARTVPLLHVEDDVFQQRVTALHLAAMPEFAFAITTATSEAEALAEFERGNHEFVLLDYHLAQGNGLSCLHQLRARDRIVPIVALSGKATPEIAAELLRVGADDYLSKLDLTAEMLARSIRTALARADAWRHALTGKEAGPVLGSVAAQFEALCRKFTADNGPTLLERLDAFEQAARQTALSAGQLQGLFESICGTAGGTDLRRLLRPLLLEVLLRLSGEGGTDLQAGLNIF